MLGVLSAVFGFVAGIGVMIAWLLWTFKEDQKQKENPDEYEIR